MRRKIRVGGRRSALAVAQARLVVDAIAAAHPGLDLELVPFRTAGDAVMRPFAEVTDPEGIKGLFTLELEQALLDGEIDLAVHSLKDVPTRLDGRLPLVAYSRREDPRDVLVLPLGGKGAGQGAIGCSSPRRKAQLGALFPGWPVEPVRGNVETRLRKLDEGQFGALVLAAAGLRRLGLEGRISRAFTAEELVPAPGQGILACQGRAGENYDYLDAVWDQDAKDCGTAERAFAARLGGGCARPVAAYAAVEGETLTLTGFFQAPSGQPLRGTVSGPRRNGESLGALLAERIGREAGMEGMTS